MKTATFPSVVAAKRAASAQLSYYESMMAPVQPAKPRSRPKAAAKVAAKAKGK